MLTWRRKNQMHSSRLSSSGVGAGIFMMIFSSLGCDRCWTRRCHEGCVNLKFLDGLVLGLTNFPICGHPALLPPWSTFHLILSSC